MRPIFLTLLLLSSLLTCAQEIGLKGNITDEQNQPVPFVSIYVKNTSKGSSANAEGGFSLKLPKGTHDIVFKAIGYASVTRSVVLQRDTTLHIVLKSESFTLKDVVIRSTGEDPAYAIIRKAIKKRKIYQRQTQPYSVEVYIKGLQRMLKSPKKFLGTDMDKMGKELGLDSNRRGIYYLSESESRLTYSPPDKFKEEMISSKVSGRSQAFSFNRASDMDLNLYDNHKTWDGLSPRPFVSPIADNALSFYNYKLIGSTMDNNVEIYKIRFSPKRKAEPVYSGEIYIVDDSWRIYSADLYMTKSAGINFVDTLRIQQNYHSISEDNWKVASTRYDFAAGFMGFKVGGYYIAVYRNYEQVAQLSKKDFREVFKVPREANKKDSTYWNQARPVPLTPEEQVDYANKQALADKRESKSYLDSVDKARNKFRPLKFAILGGYSHYDRKKNETVRFNPLLSSAYFNTVEGWGIDYKVSFYKKLDTLNNRYLSITPRVKYAFDPQRLNPSITGHIPIKKAGLTFRLGSDITDLASQRSGSSIVNSFNTLLYERNYLKLYQEKFAGVTLNKRLIGGLRGAAGIEWSERKWLPNSTDYTIVDDPAIRYTSNNPFFHSADVELFPQHQAFVANFFLSYNFSNKYISYLNGRYYPPSKYPTINLNYKTGIAGVLASDVQYHLLSFNAYKNGIQLGLYGKSSFSASAGKFLSAKSLYYVDYRHFRGNQSLGYEAQINSFQFLNPYVFSTKSGYVEGHFEHNFSTLITSKIPLIKKFKLQEVVGAHYVNTRLAKNYTEAFLGLQYLNFRLQYGIAYRQGKQRASGLGVALALQ